MVLEKKRQGATVHNMTPGFVCVKKNLQMQFQKTTAAVETGEVESFY